MRGAVAVRRLSTVAIAAHLFLLVIIKQAFSFSFHYRLATTTKMPAKKKGKGPKMPKAKSMLQQQKQGSSRARLDVGDSSGEGAEGEDHDPGVPRLVVMDLDFTLWYVQRGLSKKSACDKRRQRQPDVNRNSLTDCTVTVATCLQETLNTVQLRF